MKNSIKKGKERQPRFLLDTRIVVGFVGIFLSIVFHELFHIIMHWGDITDLGAFTDRHTIAEVAFVLPDSYDLQIEEFFAYGITAITILFTIKLLWEVQDARDKRNTSEIMSSKDKSTPQISSSEISKYLRRK